MSWAASPSRGVPDRIEIVWLERGGPPVEPPTRRGFGSRLLQMGLPLGGSVRMDFQAPGLECRLSLPVAVTAT